MSDLSVAPLASGTPTAHAQVASGQDTRNTPAASGMAASGVNEFFAMADAGSIFSDPISGQSLSPARSGPAPAGNGKAGAATVPVDTSAAAPAGSVTHTSSAVAPASTSQSAPSTASVSAPVSRATSAPLSAAPLAPATGASTALAPLAGRAFYVSTTGSDSNPGTQLQPFRTINHGARGLQPGDTLYVMGGTYAESIEDSIPGGTSWSAPVTVAAYSAQTVTLQPPSSAGFVAHFTSSQSHYIVLSGLILDGRNVGNNTVKITYGGSGVASNIRIQNSEIRNARYTGILVTGAPGAWANSNQFINDVVDNNGTTYLDHGIYIETNNNLVQGCTFYNNTGEGVQIYDGDTLTGSASYNVVSNSIFHNNSTSSPWDAGIGIYTGVGNLAFNNLVWSNPTGIAVDYNATNSLIYNNTVYANTHDGGITVGLNANAIGTVIRNNIVYQNSTGIVDSGSGTIADHNTANSTNPMFVNAVASNFHLQSGSPAINAGMTLAQVPNDFDGVARPAGAYTIGAYQYATQGQPSTDVNWSGGGITGPTTVAANSSFTVSRTFSISNAAAPNNFTIAYYASPDTVFGNGNDILLGTETISGAGLALGTHTGTSPALQLPSAGSYYLFAQLNSGNTLSESNPGNNVAMAPQPVVVSSATGSPVIVDNGTSGYWETGSGWRTGSNGYNSNARYHGAGTGADTANWQISGLAAGNYTVQATWPAYSNHATNASYQIYDGTTLLATVLVNQRVAPVGTTASGRVFQTLGTYQVSSGNIHVVLSDNANNYVFADAVRVVPS
jgi:hypothetical protein